MPERTRHATPSGASRRPGRVLLGAFALTAPLAVPLAAAAEAPVRTAACVDGQSLAPGESCVLTIKWGRDHVVEAAFTAGADRRVEFAYVEGGCSVALFGPVEAQLGPDGPPLVSQAPGAYHLFTRALTVARTACRYRITVY